MSPGNPHDELDRFAAALPPAGAGTWWVGLSGGLDSSVLLALLARLRERGATPALRAIHINHGLHPDADSWQAHCESICQALDIPLTVRAVAVAPAGRGLEAAAREARYGVFEAVLGEGDTLLLAHHRDDQVETFFLRLLRGAGSLGLSGMPASRTLGAGRLWRPLLGWDRAELEALASRLGLHWVEDGSNADTSLDRNFLRRELLPGLESRWPGYRGSVTDAAANLADSEALLERLARPILQQSATLVYGEPTLDLSVLREGDAGEAAQLLRLWLRTLALAAPGRESLREFVRQLRASGDGNGCELRAEGYQLRQFAGRVHLVAIAATAPVTAARLEPGGRLHFADAAITAQTGAGNAGRARLVAPAAGAWTLCVRSGGERCRPQGRAHSTSLKKLLQAAGVPPWWRDRVPLVYDGADLVAVGDLWVCAGHEAAPGEPGWEIHWNRDSLAPPD